MLSAQDIAAVKVAIEICTNSVLKKDILCVLETDDESFLSLNGNSRKLWIKKVKQNATLTLDKLGLLKCLQEKVIVLVILIGLNMLTWVQYHNDTFGLSFQFCNNFINSSLFDSRGIIDTKKAAEQLMKNTSLSTKQCYKLSCFYCFADKIPALFSQMPSEEQKEFYDAKDPDRVYQPLLVKFWSYYVMGDIDKLIGERSLHQYLLEKAIASGVRAAVEYCLDEINKSRREIDLISVAIDVVKNNLVKGVDEWNVFRNSKYDFCSTASKIPRQYNLDILYFLILKMREDQYIEFLRRDIEGASYKRKGKHSRILNYFLGWPYQDCFMKTVKLMWEFLSKKSFGKLLENICYKIKRDLDYLDYASYDYRKLLGEFWCASPEHLKRYIFSDKKEVCRNYYGHEDEDYDEETEILTTNKGKDLLCMLFSTKSFTIEDRKNIELILGSTTDKEKESIIISNKAKFMCYELIWKEKWGRIDLFLSNCISSIEKTDEFKRRIILTSGYRSNTCEIFIYFTKSKKWDAADLFISWGALSEEEIKKLKKEIVYSVESKHACLDLIILENGLKVAEKYCLWYLSSEEIGEFKKDLIFSLIGFETCSDLMSKGKVEFVSEYISWSLSTEGEINEFKKKLIYSNECLDLCEGLVSADNLKLVDEITSWYFSSEDERKEFKKHLAYEKGDFICANLLSNWDYDNAFDVISSSIKFDGGKYKQVELFLTWCFSSEEEIIDYKRKNLFEKSAIDIHANLIHIQKWEEAETFFSWLNLSFDEIRTLKIETLLRKGVGIHDSIVDVGNTSFDHADGKWENFKLLLRWCLIDREAVLEFQKRFDIFDPYDDGQPKGKRLRKKIIELNKFNSLVKELLHDLTTKPKKKSETLTRGSRNKKFCAMGAGKNSES